MISIEANIGSGKSTFLKKIKESGEKSFNVINEPLDEWQNTYSANGENILGNFYSDQERWSYTFQSNAFITRIQKYERESVSDKINLSERSPLSDYNIFAKMLKQDGKIDEIEWKLYQNWYTWLIEKFNAKPKAIIYLKCSPEVSFARIKKRDRNEENNIPYEYIKRVHDFHEEWLMNESDIPVLIINANNDFEDNESRFQEIMSQVKLILSNSSNNSFLLK